MSKRIAAVVIPIYKEKVDADELKSLVQCLAVLHDHPLIFVCGINLKTSFFEEFCARSGVRAEYLRFDDYFFSSITGYNKLLLSKGFYAKFKAYENILIYQLDAYVFKDELLAWCKKEFTYIGSPWFEGQDKSNEKSPFMQPAGNGGFSLRNISGFLKVLSVFRLTKRPREILDEYKHFNSLAWLVRLPLIFLRMMGLKNNSFYERNNFSLNEDHYWSFIAPELWRGFKVAEAEEAIAFAFECQPARMYMLNNSQLPFGCHAWLKYDYTFWKSFIT